MTQEKIGNRMNKQFLEQVSEGGTEGPLPENLVIGQTMTDRMIKKFSKIGFSTTAGLVLVLAGCKPHDGQAPQAQMPPPAVTVAAVQQEEIVEWDEFTGRTAAIENVEV